MQRPRPAAILLDALGTLVALAPPAPLLRVELAARFGVEVTERQAAEAIAAEIAFYRAHLDEGSDEQRLAGLRRRCAEVIRGALAGRLDAVPIAELTEALLAALRFATFPDVLPALVSLRARGVRLVVVSNWDVSLHGVLERLGIAPLLDGVLTSAEIGARKPAPEPFLRALALTGTSAADALHVGDSPAEDVAGARAAGIEPVLIARGGGRPPAGVRAIASLAEL